MAVSLRLRESLDKREIHISTHSAEYSIAKLDVIERDYDNMFVLNFITEKA